VRAGEEEGTATNMFEHCSDDLVVKVLYFLPERYLATVARTCRRFASLMCVEGGLESWWWCWWWWWWPWWRGVLCWYDS
jgi:hypothetical protein